ncbi:GNAT family N-acetyltransferase [Pseudodesulfovibrio sediminis]|uniref:Phosphinothricin acetyltransferase n=1 Tax=Pseudodesulfovibrio sediminis TaxID=2810563 RepID=A0ABM7P3H9_9BACT|nr:GNAT family N-acetyltransferase [Pseudodesulfovibrio sediminis]BCS87370.1 phosphinothricin acetyltransferase [Pseudodesulfovibrio sediminis]
MRDATEQDLPRIVAIYNSTVRSRQSTADTEEVSVESKRSWFRGHVPGKRPILVHEEGEQIAAWVSFESFYGRPAYRHTAEISIYIAPEFRRQGLGRRLLQEALELCPALCIKTILGYIFSHNEPSLKLFQSFGFEQWAHLPDIAEMDDQEYSLSIFGKRVIP